jgi:hypothetical protein
VRSVTEDLEATGTLSATGNFVLTFPISGGTATLTAALPQNLHTLIPGTWVISGGACAAPSTTISIMQYPVVSGTYKGTFNVLNLNTSPPSAVPGTATAITAVLNQSAISNADGQFPLAGTITLTGACAASFSFTDGIVFGDGILSHPPSGPVGTQGDFIGGMDPTGVTIYGTFDGLTICNSQPYQGTLTLQ